LTTDKRAEQQSTRPVFRGITRPAPVGRLLAAAVWLVAAVVALGERECLGQLPGGAQPADSPSADLAQADAVFAPAERSVILLLDRTRLLLQEDRYAEAVQCLDRILSGNEDYFFRPDANTSVHRSIKSEARGLLGSLPPSGRKSYELQFGAYARSMLDEGVETGSVPMIAEVARRFFHTEAGYEASYLLGLHHMDHGRPLVAALTLRRLRDESHQTDRFEPSLSLVMARCWLAAGMPEQARQTLDALRDAYRGRPVTIEGREAALFGADDDALDWLLASLGPENASLAAEPDDWTIHGGSPQRLAVSRGSRPLMNARWHIPATDYPAVEAMIDQIQQQQEEREAALLPGLHPLVIGNAVLMRTATNLLAVDLETGKRLWEVPAEEPFEAAVDPLPNLPNRLQSNLDTGLLLRLWGDAAFGTLSSDGRRVFAVEDLHLPMPAVYARLPLIPGIRGRSQETSLTTNRLAAFDIRSEGKLQWELGGPHSETPLPLAGAFFLGPPLPLLGDLYVLAEIEGEVRVLALNAETGDVLWQQQLAVVAESVYLNTLRRVSGVSPSYADGILVCPTSHHSIVALELTTRSLLWGYSYADTEGANERGANLFGSARHQLANPADRWTDSTLIVADGRVLATPIDSEQLHCLSLDDGRLLWRVPRGDRLYVAAVDDGKVVIAGRKGLTALSLQNGEPAWDNRLAACPADSEPSGRGFSDGNLYYLPLTGGKLMTVRLSDGKVEQVYRSRRGCELGNLVCHGSRIISQHAGGVEAYDQFEALQKSVNERLAAQPDDAEALALRGEVLWDAGHLDEAVECLRKSIQLSDSFRARSLLRDVMFDGLEREFARYQACGDEIETLLDTVDDRARFHRLNAAGWETAGRYDRALAEYRTLVAIDLEQDGFVEVDDGYSVRQDRWIWNRLLHLAETAPDTVRAELVDWVGDTLQSAQLAQGPDRIGRALQYFGGLPGTREATDEWIRRLAGAGRLAEAELALMEEVRRADRTELGERLARWTTMLAAADRPADAASLLKEIETRWPDVSFDGGKTGRQWAAEFAAQHEAIGKSRVPVQWPRGHVKSSVAESESGNVFPTYSRGFVPFQNEKGVFCRDLAIEHQQQFLVAKNGLGQVQWQFPLDRIDDLNQLAANRGLVRAAACGHILIVSLGDRVVALDTLATNEDGSPKVAWSESTEGVNPAVFMRNVFQFAGGNSMLADSMGHSPGTASLLGESLVCVKRSRTCAALDPATGQTLWERDGIPTQSAVFGDEHYVLIVPRQSTTARVLRASDGAELESRVIPPEEQRLAAIGRRIVCWEPGDGILKMVDPVGPEQEEVVWGPQRFPLNSRAEIVDDKLIAVYSPEGKFRLIRMDDGTAIIDTEFQSEMPVTDVLVFRQEGNYIVVANNSLSSRDPKRQVQPMAGLRARRIGTARIFAFDGNGAALWEKATVVENHCLPLTQLPGVPCLTFACMVYEAADGRPRQAKVDILCVDTRSGNIVARRQFAHASHAFEVAAIPEKARVEIRMQQETLALQFTDEPVPEEGYPDQVLDATGAPSNPLEAIWRAVIDGTTVPEGKYYPRKTRPDPVPAQADPLPPKHVKEPAQSPKTDQAEALRKIGGSARQAIPPPPLEPALRDVIPPAQEVPSR